VNYAANQVLAASNKNIGSSIVLSDKVDSTSRCAFDSDVCTAVNVFPSLSMTFLDRERRHGFHVYPAVDQVFEPGLMVFQNIA